MSKIKNQNESLLYSIISIAPYLFSFLILLILTQGLVNILSVISLAPVMDVILNKSEEEYSFLSAYMVNFLGLQELTLEVVFLSFILLLFASNMLGIFVQYWILKIKYKVIIYFMSDIHETFFEAKYSFFSESNAGELINSFQKEAEKLGDIFGSVGRLVSNFLQLIIYLSIPFFISLNMTLIFIVAIAFFSIPLLVMNRYIYPFGERNTSTANEYVSYLQQTFEAAKLILIFSRQKESLDEFKLKFLNHANVSVPFQTLLFSINLLAVPLGFSAALIAVYVGFYNGVSLSLITIVLFSFFRITPLISATFTSRSEIVGFSPAYEQLKNLKNIALDNKFKNGSLVFENFHSIKVSKLSFSYYKDDYALKDVSMDINKGKTISIIGESGSGKTTIVDILLGLYKGQSGEIKINDIDLYDYNINTFREKVGVVSQDSFLFDQSIRQNLLWANHLATEDDMWNVLKKSQIDDFVKSQRHGLDTIVGNRGARMSGGQRQRISLARALIKQPDLIILDEATSSLDVDSERKIQESIDNLNQNHTFLVIAHRLSTIKNSDYIYVLDNGSIFEEGSYDDLIRDENSYLSRMGNLQKS
tara:strand:+ start:2966 stop:4735 length:1770 start_codon:yes stop_codon:yes gene_type:complete